jgi:hypothetical protein
MGRRLFLFARLFYLVACFVRKNMQKNLVVCKKIGNFAAEFE